MPHVPAFRLLAAATALALLAGIAALSPAVRADCPANTISLYDPISYAVAVAADSTALGRVGAFDAIAGTIRIRHPGGLGDLGTAVSDRFRVVGLPDGTPVTVVPVLDVNGVSLPPGARVQSCWGLDSVTPTRAASWGSVKIRYH